MRYAVLSDIHANLEALQAVLADAVPRTDALLCLGDLVGYGADPVACIETVAARAQTLVCGNHEHAVAGLLDMEWFNAYARAAAEWTRERIDEDHRSYLASLPLVAEVGDATLVHASPDRPDEWEYLLTAQDGFDAFSAFTTRLCFVGHSHLAGAWSLGSSGPEYRAGAVDVEVERGTVSIRRVVYDVAAAREKILRGGLPRFLADRLAWGS